jgi:hypothetical protein
LLNEVTFPLAKAKYYYYDAIPSSVRGTMLQIGTIKKVDHQFDPWSLTKRNVAFGVPIPSWTPVNQWHSINNAKRVCARLTRKQTVKMRGNHNLLYKN